ncbi:MAG: restriction endonuclease subunit S, partial [Candidatus Nitrosopelagicus sp.]|nr:restriction endonuclease subunit S [Candidatus Nitrosopelagicus sp.]
MSLVTPRKGYKSVPWLFGKEIEIPEEWEYGRIEHFCNKITSGGTPNRDNSEYYGGQIPWIKSGELKNNFLSESEEKISEKGLSESSAKLFPKNTLLIAMYGVTIGKTAILEKEATTNQAICAILPNTNFDSFYLQQLLISMKNILISFGMGAGQPNINQEIIKTLHIPLPPLPEQQKIATILSNVDNL